MPKNKASLITLPHNLPNRRERVNKMSDMKLRVDLEPFRRRYLAGGRQVKSKLLDELVDLYGYNRKYLGF